MTSLFDGLAGVLNDLFGAPVTHRPAVGDPVTIRAVFREQPVRLTTEDGAEVLSEMPTLEAQKPYADQIRPRDTIEVADGRTFVVRASAARGGPAGDGFKLFELEETT